jgi:hypothetical protein
MQERERDATGAGTKIEEPSACREERECFFYQNLRVGSGNQDGGIYLKR